jgi:hypothetical protein
MVDQLLHKIPIPGSFEPFYSVQPHWSSRPTYGRIVWVTPPLL